MSTEEIVDMEVRIIEAAKQVFVRKGYVQATMTDIANEAGIGRTALHYYYRTKEMLFNAIFEQLLSTLLPNIKKVMDGEGTMLVKLPRIVQEYATVLQYNMQFPIFIISEVNRDPEHLYQVFLKKPELIQPILQLREQLTREMDEGIIRKMPLIDLITACISMIVFPLLIRNPLTAVFLDGKEENFKEYIIDRTPRIIHMIDRLLTPDEDK